MNDPTQKEIALFVGLMKKLEDRLQDDPLFVREMYKEITSFGAAIEDRFLEPTQDSEKDSAPPSDTQ